MTNSYKSAAASACLVIALSACTFRTGEFTLISTMDSVIPSASKGPRVKGEDCVWVTIVPIGQPSMQEATSQALRSAGPEYDVLVNTVVTEEARSVVLGKLCYVVEGTAINTKKILNTDKALPAH